MPYEVDDRRRRHEKDLRRLGTRMPRCPHCHETAPAALARTKFGIICIECLKRRRGEQPTELHHLSGQHNDPTAVAILANDHAILSDLQMDWRDDVLLNPDENPLLGASAAIRGWLDVLRVIIERTAGWIPPFLEGLNAILCELFGDQWWQRPEFGTLAM